MSDPKWSFFGEIKNNSPWLLLSFLSLWMQRQSMDADNRKDSDDGKEEER
jgi:hypothetical protein